jgi:hypothetical protein
LSVPEVALISGHSAVPVHPSESRGHRPQARVGVQMQGQLVGCARPTSGGTPPIARGGSRSDNPQAICERFRQFSG